MLRLSTSLAVLLACTTAPAFAADWADDWGDEGAFRGGYINEPKDWSGLNDEYDGIHIETGLRYWYSMGSQSFGALGQNFESSDTTHTGELHLRIDDDASATYVKGWAGYSMAISGTYSDDISVDAPVGGGHVGYAGADFGWNAFNDGNGNGAGFLVGYQYWNDSPRTGRTNFTTATSGSDLTWDPTTGLITGMPGNSVENNIDVNALRLGLSGRARIGDMFDFSGELAAVPYATISGVLGGSAIGSGDTTTLGNPLYLKSSETEINGWGYGAMAEAMVGVTPIENLTFRLGGRAWYLQGTADATYSALQVSDPTESTPSTPANYDTAPGLSGPQYYIDRDNPWSLFRYGLLAELTYAF